MPFFPILNSNFAKGFTTAHNFSPNNWEKISEHKKNIWAIYSNGDCWKTKHLGEIGRGESKTFYYDDILKIKDQISFPLVLLQLRKSHLENNLDYLPSQELGFTKSPEWRATVGLELNQNQTSYQGEINPFPKKASLLTFHPFIQPKIATNNFIFINLEGNPSFREEDLEIYDSRTKKIIDVVSIKSNNVNEIQLDKYNLSAKKLPVFLCRRMAGIPFGFGLSKKYNLLSLEHTHPPGSFVVHGDRFQIQREIKTKWFNILKRNA